MHIAKSILFMLSGATAGIAFVISCGDNWHLGADAAVDATADAPKAPDAAPGCDCPAAEPPITGRLYFDSSIAGVDGNQEQSVGRFCPPGAIAISGSCKLSTPIFNPRKDVILREAGLIYGPVPSGWRCTVRNNESETVLYEIFVLCLKPAP